MTTEDRNFLTSTSFATLTVEAFKIIKPQDSSKFDVRERDFSL